MKTVLAVLFMTTLTGCAGIEHATRTARETACTDNWGTAIAVNQRTQVNCPFGTAREFWGAAQASDTVVHTETVITPQGTYQIIQLGRLTTVSRVAKTAR